MDAILKQLRVNPQQSEEALGRALKRADVNNNLETHLVNARRQAEIEAQLPDVKITDSNSQQVIEQTLHALEEVKPEAKQAYLNEIIRSYCGAKGTKQEQAEVIPFDGNLESKINAQLKVIKRYTDQIEIYLFNKDKLRGGLQNLGSLAEASILDSVEVQNYHSLLNRIDRALGQPSLVNYHSYKICTANVFACVSSFCGFLIDAAVCAGLAMFSHIDGISLYFIGVYGVLGAILIGPAGNILGKSKATELKYKQELMAWYKAMPTLDHDIGLALTYAKKFDGEICNPKKISKAYEDRMPEVAHFMEGSKSYVKFAIETLEKLK